MIKALRDPHNPLLIPNKDNPWEANAVFNASVTRNGDLYRMVYRAQSSTQKHFGKDVALSSIGAADSADGIHFHYRRQLILPEKDWEKWGCEDPRITTLDGKHYILYTALSGHPPGPSEIKIALATTHDFESIDEKHLVTTFNAKAGALFPERINDSIYMLLSVNTDNPPTDIAIAKLERESDLWSAKFWNDWYEKYHDFTLQLKRSSNDHVEVGAAPVRTDKGWLFVYSYIYNYFNPPATFAVEIALLDLENPYRIIGKTPFPLLKPREYYELFGEVPNIVFPTGAIKENNTLGIFYGAADTSICKFNLDIDVLFDFIQPVSTKNSKPVLVKKYEHNPIISPIPENTWESDNAYNPAAIYLDNKVHILYRAQNKEKVSVVGYASSNDGFTISQRLNSPVYIPKESFEINDTGSYGCEDPRLSLLEDIVYMTYTAYQGGNQAQVALTSITTSDFIAKKWEWKPAQIISPPGMFDKNACILSKKIRGKYAIFHRIDHYIWLDYVSSLDFTGDRWIEGSIVMKPRSNSWDSLKIGIASPPLECKYGWVLLYHGLSKTDQHYRVGAALLDLENPHEVLTRLEYPILEPKLPYELKGDRPGTVFPCGAVLIGETLFIYYGSGDTFVSVGTLPFNDLVRALLQQ